MHIFIDIFERNIRLTEERLQHLQEAHPEMEGQLDNIATTLKSPEIVITSISDENVELFYCFYTETVVGDKWLCVIIKNLGNDFFVITAYFTDKIKKGNIIWKKQ
ncbi:MAG: hypothetical protein SFU99_20090 [Saprospiraceae bacterium]|nr:hypothetical protein [Saprospiraceae bacterium]